MNGDIGNGFVIVSKDLIDYSKPICESVGPEPFVMLVLGIVIGAWLVFGLTTLYRLYIKSDEDSFDTNESDREY